MSSVGVVETYLYENVTETSCLGAIKIPTYKPHTNHKKPSVSSHTLAPTTICDLSHSVCGSPLTDLGHISLVTFVSYPLWFVCGHRKGILTSPQYLRDIYDVAVTCYFGGVLTSPNQNIKPIFHWNLPLRRLFSRSQRGK